MVKLIFLPLVIACICSASARNPAWNKFKADHSITYSSAKEENHRYMIFKDNLGRIQLHNERFDKGLETYQQGINWFADKTHAEAQKLTANIKVPKSFLSNVTTVHKFLPGQPSPPPSAIDWRTRANTIGPVKNQMACDTCWAFAATGVIEAHYSIYKTQKLSLSEQQLVDCDKTNKGCKGGWPVYALYYVKKNGITGDAQYAYTAKDGTCKYNSSMKVASISGVVETEKNNELALQIAVAKKGPVAIAFDGGAKSFLAYKSGIYSAADCVATKLSHAALIVGYGSNSGIDFWIGRNSYGEGWGERGYFRMRRNANNMCGVAAAPCYPTI